VIELQVNSTYLEDYIMEKSLFEQNGITYHWEGDYLIPDLVPPKSVPVGVWDQRRRKYLREQKKPLYTAMLLGGKLDAHLADIDQQAEELFSRLVQQMAEREGITERLKVENQMEWVGKMNSIQACAMEIVNSEIIYMI
jgi:hypothetical protein